MRACSVTSSPSASGRGIDGSAGDRGGPGAEDDLRRVRVAVDVPLGGRRRVAGHAEGAAHEHAAPEQAGAGRLAQHGDGEVRERPERDQRDLAGPPASLVEDEVDGVAVAERPARRRQLGVAEALRAVGLGRRLERPHERHLAAEGDLDVGPTGQLQDRPRVARDLARVDVAGDAGHREELGLGRGGGVEEREAVVDAGVDVEDQRDALGQPRC